MECQNHTGGCKKGGNEWMDKWSLGCRQEKKKNKATRHDTVVCVVIGKVEKGSRKFDLIAVEV